MIYCIPIENYPDKNQVVEEIIYKDENQLEWRIARVKNGFIVKYFGHQYFKENRFNIETENGKSFQINNTNCIFFNDTTLDGFMHVRNILKKGYTDDIWETFENLFTLRFNLDSGILDSERIS